MSLSEDYISALRNIAEAVVPERIDWKDIRHHLNGYSKEKVIEQLIEKAKEDPLFTRIRLSIIYTELKKVADNGGLL